MIKRLFKRKIIETLQHTNNMLVDENKVLRNKNKELKHNNIILIENSAELRDKIKDLENNIELLYNNLSPKKKEIFKK